MTDKVLHAQRMILLAQDVNLFTRGGPMKDKELTLRIEMVSLIERLGVRDERVLAVMRKVPRHLFVPDEMKAHAYEDSPLPIGYQQTISQPYIVAEMLALARLTPSSNVLEVGTGSGYQAALLAELCREVCSIELVEPLAKRAQSLLHDLGYRNVKVLCGDGYSGFPTRAPFDAILITASTPELPEALLQQLAIGGRLVAPVEIGGEEQELVAVTRETSGFITERICGVRFVPMLGQVRRNAL